MNLSPIEVRVLGCLIEKAATTPEHYPLTTNSLTAACNQKTSRDPVTDYSSREVDDAMLLLRPAGYARTAMGGRSPKHRHVAEEKLSADARELGVLAVLMLRGPQTPGELRTRTERAVGFESVEEVDDVLRSLAERDIALVADLGRGPGQSQNRWQHLLGDGNDAELTSPEATAASNSSSATAQSNNPTRVADSAASSSPDLAARVAALEQRIQALEEALGAEEPDQSVWN